MANWELVDGWTMLHDCLFSLDDGLYEEVKTTVDVVTKVEVGEVSAAIERMKLNEIVDERGAINMI